MEQRRSQTLGAACRLLDGPTTIQPKQALGPLGQCSSFFASKTHGKSRKSLLGALGALLGLSWPLFGRGLLLLGASWGAGGLPKASGSDFGATLDLPELETIQKVLDLRQKTLFSRNLFETMRNKNTASLKLHGPVRSRTLGLT